MRVRAISPASSTSYLGSGHCDFGIIYTRRALLISALLILCSVMVDQRYCFPQLQEWRHISSCGVRRAFARSPYVDQSQRRLASTAPDLIRDCQHVSCWLRLVWKDTRLNVSFECEYCDQGKLPTTRDLFSGDEMRNCLERFVWT